MIMSWEASRLAGGQVPERRSTARPGARSGASGVRDAVTLPSLPCQPRRGAWQPARTGQREGTAR
jgi:hypothetical protein